MGGPSPALVAEMCKTQASFEDTVDVAVRTVAMIEIYEEHTITAPSGNEVTILFHSGSGSGVLMGKPLAGNQFVVTCHHVTEGAKRLEVHIPFQLGTFQTEMVLDDPDHDLAVLHVLSNIAFPVAHFAPRLPRLGADCFVIGNPFDIGISVSRGIISGYNRNRKETDGHWIQVAAAVNPGNSGGALFDIHGNLIGIINRGIRGSGLGFAVPLPVVRADVVKALGDWKDVDLSNLELPQGDD
jgi:S1-C subfamily serine protease